MVIDSRTPVPLKRTFLWILAGIGGLNSDGCGTTSSSVGGCKPPLETQSYSQAVDAARLRLALADGVISQSECLQLCSDPPLGQLESCSIQVMGSLADCAPLDAALGDGGGEPTGGSAGAIGTSSAGVGACAGLIDLGCTVKSRLFCEGRRHAGWRPRATPARVAREPRLAGWYARAAANEAGSVQSFRLLARELRKTPLGRRYEPRLRRAAQDEIRHARAMRAEAQRYGATPVGNEFRAVRERSLLEIALENAREGCVEETYAALIAQVQALRLSSAETGRTFDQIAADETRHAELAWDLHFAIRLELEELERAQLDAALRGFIDDLSARTSCAMPVEVAAELGLPDARLDRALRERLARALHARC